MVWGRFPFNGRTPPAEKSFNLLRMTKILLEPVVLSADVVRVDVKALDVPANFFGISFHLGIGGLGWKLQSYELGDVFKGENPFFLAFAKEHEIIAGMVLKRGDIVDVHDGVLMSFLVRPTSGGRMDFSFSNEVLSVFRHGRVDLSNVEWVSGSVNVAWNKSAASDVGTPLGLVSVDLVPESVISAGSLAADVKVSTFMPGSRISDLYEFLGLILFVFIVFSGIYLLYISRKRR